MKPCPYCGRRDQHSHPLRGTSGRELLVGEAVDWVPREDRRKRRRVKRTLKHGG